MPCFDPLDLDYNRDRSALHQDSLFRRSIKKRRDSCDDEGRFTYDFFGIKNADTELVPVDRQEKGSLLRMCH